MKWMLLEIMKPLHMKHIGAEMEQQFWQEIRLYLISPIRQNGLSSYSGLKTGEEQGLCMCTIPVPARYSK